MKDSKKSANIQRDILKLLIIKLLNDQMMSQMTNE